MKRDRRLIGIVLTVLVVVVLGWVLNMLPETTPRNVVKSGGPEEAVLKPISINPNTDPKGHEQAAREKELRARFQQAVAMLHAKQYDYAIKSLHRVLELAPRLPEAHVNMGYALIGLKQYQAAADFFDTAITLRPMQINAYYGLALAHEGLENYRTAISAMESFIHLTDENDPALIKARSASWEWGEMLRIELSGEPAPRVVGRDVRTGELVDKKFGSNMPTEGEVKQ